MVGAISIGSYGYAQHAKADISVPTPPVSLPTSGTVKDVVTTVKNTVAPDVKNGTDATSALCDAIGPKVDDALKDFDAKYADHLSYYKKQREALQLLVGQLNDQKIDTSKLRADLVLFDLKMKKFEDDKPAVEQKLQDIKTFKCEDQLTKSATALAGAVSDEKAMMTDTKDILSYLNGTIESDVTALRSK